MKRRHVLIWGLVGIFAALVSALALVSPAAASGSIQVTTTTDEYGEGAACSLREAVTAISNTTSFGGCTYASGEDTILLTSGSVYSLTRTSTDENLNVNGDLDIRQSMTITVANGGLASITAAGNVDRVLEITIFGATVAVSNLAIRDGTAPSLGGGVILNRGTLLLDRVTVQNGDTNLKGPGGGIWNFGGVMTITNSVLENNLATGLTSGYGGGIANIALTSTARLTLINTSVITNFADSFGGGIYNEGSILEIRNTTINNNNVDQDRGGGMYMFSGSAGLYNVTISDNVAGDSYGGGIFHNGGVLTFSNTLIVQNNAGQGGEDCYTEAGQFIKSYGNNILGTWQDSECWVSIEPDTPAVISNTAVTLSSLGYYVSSLPTRALTSGSAPALNGGYVSGNGVPCEATDQRGWSRSVAAPCDIGAFELVDLQTVYLPLVRR